LRPKSTCASISSSSRSASRSTHTLRSRPPVCCWTSRTSSSSSSSTAPHDSTLLSHATT
jgi:hypothetical protein